MKELIWQQILKVRENAPLVHNITNYVVMNNTANALLACGASPVMAHAYPEMDDMVAIAGALVVNIGTLDEYWVESMETAASQAVRLNKPWVLDPVGAGATPYRNQVIKQLMAHKPSIIRGNASEIISIAGAQTGTTKGVDSVHGSSDAVNVSRQLNKTSGAVVCVSGATDFIISGSRTAALDNGHPMMSRVTGLGCTASALTGAFAAVNPSGLFLACVSAMALLGVAGEFAASKAQGPGTLQLYLLDELYGLKEEDFMRIVKVSERDGE